MTCADPRRAEGPGRRRGVAGPAHPRRRVLRAHGMTAALNEVRLLAGRSLRHIPRIPRSSFGAIVVPLVFVLLFAYVFGSGDRRPGRRRLPRLPGVRHLRPVDDRDAPGRSRSGSPSDIRSGLMDRLRALPIMRGSVIAGRTVAELAELCVGLVVIAGCAAVSSAGRRTARSSDTIGAFGLLILMAFAVTWVGRVARPDRQRPGWRRRDRDGRDLPGDVPVRDLRAGRRPAGRAPPDRRVEPTDRTRDGVP